MKIAIASGKGGTGKTTLAVSLAMILTRAGQSVRLYDCDVEEPNGHLFLSPPAGWEEAASVPAPYLSDPEACTRCGLCARVCRFNAVAAVKTEPLFFPELCHGCGGCLLACPAGALKEGRRRIGLIKESSMGSLQFIQGVLDVGEAMAAPLIKKILERTSAPGLHLIDSPPGTSCSMLAAAARADKVLLVTEPTPFGLHDLNLAVNALTKMGKPFGVIENKAEEGEESPVTAYCRERGIPLLFRIPFSLDIARAYSRGELALVENQEISQGLLKMILAQGGTEE